ncbi:hypothetical protein BSKO_13305 [Bryopsis sp. KO-2023]|nr:hypothetical protein BSKO_13305 [Bryopsis sp. KO-2023]
MEPEEKVELPPDFACGGDGNDDICGACLGVVGTLICCESCPAAYHPQCTGYADVNDVPDGDWYCWMCAKKRGLSFPPENVYSGEGGTIMVSLDDSGEIFYMAEVMERKGDKLKIVYADQPGKVVDIDVRQRRIWCGTVMESAWMEEVGGAFRPKSRVFEVDFRYLGVAGEMPKITGIQTIPGGEAMPPPLVVGTVLSDLLERKKKSVRERKFMAALRKFWKDEFGKEELFPSYGYIVPLCELWGAVQFRGGYDQVCEKNLWKEVGRELDSDATVKHLPFVAKNTYKESLSALEKAGGMSVLTKCNSGKKSQASGTRKRGKDVSDKSSIPAGKRQKVMPQISELIVPIKAETSPALIDLASAFVPSGMYIREVDEPICARKSRPVAEHPPDQWSQPVPGPRTASSQITDAVHSMTVGDIVECRTVDDGRLSAWYEGKIQAIVPGSEQEGFRRFKICWEPNSHRPVTPEWVSLTSWLPVEAPDSQLVVLVRVPDRLDAGGTVQNPEVGDQVEASFHGGWVGADIVKIEVGSVDVVLRRNDSPLGFGVRWSSPQALLRPSHPKAAENYGMIDAKPGVGIELKDPCLTPQQRETSYRGKKVKFWSYPALDHMPRQRV